MVTNQSRPNPLISLVAGVSLAMTAGSVYGKNHRLARESYANLERGPQVERVKFNGRPPQAFWPARRTRKQRREDRARYDARCAHENNAVLNELVRASRAITPEQLERASQRYLGRLHGLRTTTDRTADYNRACLTGEKLT